jgi:GNAT superfamily N-acetyltransferase
VKQAEQFEIRPATPDDLKSIKAVFKSHEHDYDWKFAKRYFRSYLERPEQHADEFVLVGLHAGRVAGLVGYLRDRGGAPGVYWLGWYYVHSEERGNGFGKRLFDHVVAELRGRGARKLYTDTSSWRFYARARQLYAAFGFREEGTLQDYYEKGEHQVIYGMDLS